MSRILVVDDEQDLCEILRFDLEAEGFDVAVANSAEEALALLDADAPAVPPSASARPQHPPFDLLLLDVMMDRMSGFDLASHLRDRGIQTPIIFLTASDNYPQAFATGADDFIQKPFSFDNVLLRIRAVLRRAQGHPSPTPSLPAIDTHRCTVVHAGGQVELTRRECAILQLLHSHPGHYLSRSDIMDAAWPDDTLVTERTVDVHIARLRKKIAPAGLQIVNKIGVGYGLV